MKFEHLIEINDFLNPLRVNLTREQIWRGLVLRAESPKLFISYLDECQILERHEHGVSRQLRYGDLQVQDRVTYVHMQSVEYDVPVQKDIPHSSLRMVIEEPQPEAFFVRFAYDDGHTVSEDEENAMYNEFRRSAYQEADIETIRVIREMVENGDLPAWQA